MYSSAFLREKQASAQAQGRKEYCLSRLVAGMASVEERQKRDEGEEQAQSYTEPQEPMLKMGRS